MKLIQTVCQRYRQDGMIGLFKSIIIFIQNSLLVLYDRHISEIEMLSYGGVQIQINHDVFSVKMKKKVIMGSYEATEVAIINRNLHLFEDLPLIELGGGIGFISCKIDKESIKESTHLVVEPNPKLTPIIKKHKELNKAAFEILPYAYSSDNNSVEFYVRDHFWSGRTNNIPDNNDVISVSSINIESIIRSYEIQEFGIIVDIEGAEYDLLDNELEVLEEKAKFILMEFHGNQRRQKFYKTLLMSSGFNIIDKSGSSMLFRNEKYC